MASNTKTSPRTLTVIEGREENRRMVDDFGREAKKRGWNYCQLSGINSDRVSRFDFSAIPLDYVIFRDLSNNNYIESERLLLWLQKNNKICMNANAAGGRVCTSDKHFQQGLFMMDPFLRKHALPTFESKSKTNTLAYVKAKRIHFPFLMKPRLGTIGAGIILVEKPEDLDAIDNYYSYIIEQYIEPECDFRVFVIGGTAVGIMRKIGDPDKPGDFKIWSSGQKRFLEKDPEVIAILSDIATRAAGISKLEYTGVDILREAKTGKYYVLETNFAAGWGNSFIETTRANIPAFTLDWFEDLEAAKHQPVSEAVTQYIERRKKFLPTKVREDYDSILSGDGSSIDSYVPIFSKYPNRYSCDAGKIFKKLASLYRNSGSSSDDALKQTIQEIESLPLSWAGNFIGPEVGTINDGAILSAMYLYLLHKSAKI